MNEQDKQIAAEILRQLGGQQFAALTGARCFAIEKGLHVKFKGSRKADILQIRLNGGDLYDLEFYKLKKVDGNDFLSRVLVEKFEDVYCDQLVLLFESVTNLYAHF